MTDQKPLSEMTHLELEQEVQRLRAFPPTTPSLVSETQPKAQCHTWPFPKETEYWRARALTAEAELAVARAAHGGCTEKLQRMPEFASILRQIRERGEDPYCGFEELLCEIIRQLERELAEAREIANRETLSAAYWKDKAQSARAAIVEECATEAAIHSNYPIADDWDEGYAAGRRAAAREIRALASTAKDDPACCCVGYFTETGYCPVHGPLDGRNK